MGASTSSNTGLTLQGLIEEANRLLARISELVTQMVTTTLEAAMSDLHEKGLATIASTSATIEQTVAEVIRQNEAAAVCMQGKETEIQSIKNKMKDKILECYNKFKTASDKLAADRSSMHAEAEKIKLETHKMIQTCLASEDNFECFQNTFPEIRKKVNALYNRFQSYLKREADIQVVSAKQMFDCNQKAVDNATKELNRIVEEIKKCAADAVNKS